MISTRRMLAAAALAAGVAGLAAPMANAADAVPTDAGKLNPIALLDDLAVSDIPAEHRDKMPSVSGQVSEVKKLGGIPNELGQLHQLTDLAAPVTGLLPAIEG
ncbi:hypothetical protein DF268_25480 [Streptomyces sp. V2]|uniref:Secreted protein n=1 Tax=Streptomyces niveiscabiei TaxID=164115 RepID=A0ABW9HLM4_9ACTN|nr:MULTISPECIES: hypothetical protein [Streptomyces]PWG10782.1 hypothetical protein DF268_25480 [Streptomyces sp. V2]QZZ25944.1 hypothetical protein A7X85_06535 [Streptomyces sp. ST1015]